MGGMRVHRSEAKRYTAMAQAGAGVLLAAAFGAYAFLPVAGQVQPPPARVTPPTTGDQTSTGPAIDFEAISEGLAVYDIHPDKPEQHPEAGSEPVKPPTAEEKTQWKYLGAIVEPTRIVAIVEYEGAQHLVSPGTELDGMKVLEVGPASIVVSESGARRTINLAPKQGAVVGTATDISSESTGQINPEGEMEPDMGDPRAVERRVPRRPGVQGSKGVPKPPRSTGSAPGRPLRPTTPQGN